MILRRFKTAIASGVAGLALATSTVATCPPLAKGQFRNEELLARVDYIAGKKVLILDGGVDDHAAARADAALRTYGPVDQVWLNSPAAKHTRGRLSDRCCDDGASRLHMFTGVRS